MKKIGVVALVLGLTGAIVPLLPPEPALAQVRVQRLWAVESADLDDRGRPLSDCAGQYRSDPGPKARMRGACESENPDLLGVPLMLRHINGETGAVSNIRTFTIDAIRGAVLDARTPADNVPVATTDTDVIQVIGPDGSVVMMGGWELP